MERFKRYESKLNTKLKEDTGGVQDITNNLENFAAINIEYKNEKIAFIKEIDSAIISGGIFYFSYNHSKAQIILDKKDILDIKVDTSGDIKYFIIKTKSMLVYNLRAKKISK